MRRVRQLVAGRLAAIPPPIALAASLSLITVCTASLPQAAAPRTSNSSSTPAVIDVSPRIDAVLEQRSRAVLAGDEAMFVSAIDPDQSELIAHERMVFANLRQMRFSVLHYRQWTADTPIKLGRDATTTDDVVLVVELADVQRGATATGYSYSFRRTPQGVEITDIHAEALSGLRTGIPWDLDPLSAMRSGPVTLMVDSSVTNAADLAQRASTAVTHDRQVWGSRDAPSGFLAFVTRSETVAKRWFGLQEAVDGLSYPMQKVTATGRPTRAFACDWEVLYYPLGAYQSYSNGPNLDTFEYVTRHEFTHAMTAYVQDPNRPSWALEGYANWVMHGDNQAQRFVALIISQAQGGDVAQLPSSQQEFQKAGKLGYALGESVFLFISQHWGSERASDFYIGMMQAKPLDDVTTALFSLSSDQFLGQWRAYLKGLR